ncbi:MAG: hypothetical protein KJ915_05960 [Candidatus Omnitrophica bacterium]|nr:hypothetical protein [Candidatus Omnitrophota bacterium]
MKHNHILRKIISIIIIEAILTTSAVLAKEISHFDTLSPATLINSGEFLRSFKYVVTNLPESSEVMLQDPQNRRQWSDIKEKQLICWIKESLPYTTLPSEHEIAVLSDELSTEKNKLREKLTGLVFIRNHFLTLSNDQLTEALTQQATTLEWNNSAVKRRLHWFGYSRWDSKQKRQLWDYFRDGITTTQIDMLANELGKPAEELQIMLDLYTNISEKYFTQGFDALCVHYGYARNDANSRALLSLINTELKLHRWTQDETLSLFARMSDDFSILARDFDKTPQAVVQKLREFPIVINRFLKAKNPGKAKALIEAMLAHGGERAIIKIEKLLLPEKNGGLSQTYRAFKTDLFPMIIAASFGKGKPIQTYPQEELRYINPDEIKQLGHFMLTGSIPESGVFYFGQRWGKFPAGQKFQAEFYNGFPRRIFFDTQAIGQVFFPIINRESGTIIGVHTGTITRKRLLAYGDIETTLYLGDEGRLSLGGSSLRADGSMPDKQLPWGKLGAEYAGEKAKVFFSKGLLNRCASMESKLTQDFVLIWKKSAQQYVSAFLNRLWEKELNLLDEDYEIHGLTLSKDGSLNLGGREDWINFGWRFGHQKVNIDQLIKSGEKTFITSAQAFDKNKVPQRRSLSLLHEAITSETEQGFTLGAVIDVFEKISKRKMIYNSTPLKTYFVSNIRLSPSGYLEHNGYWARFAKFPSALVELLIIDGENTYVKFCKDTNGNPINDYRGNPLLINIQQDIYSQLVEKSPLYEQHYLTMIHANFEKGLSLFEQGQYHSALKMFISVLYLNHGRKTTAFHESLLQTKARIYIEHCREEIQWANTKQITAQKLHRLRESMLQVHNFFHHEQFAEAQKLLWQMNRQISEFASNPPFNEIKEEIDFYLLNCSNMLHAEAEKNAQKRMRLKLIERYETAKKLFYEGKIDQAHRRFAQLFVTISATDTWSQYRDIIAKIQKYQSIILQEENLTAREKEISAAQDAVRKSKKYFFTGKYAAAKKSFQKIIELLNQKQDPTLKQLQDEAQSFLNDSIAMIKESAIEKTFNRAMELKKKHQYRPALNKLEKLAKTPFISKQALKNVQDNIDECIRALEYNANQRYSVERFSIAPYFNDKIAIAAEEEQALFARIARQDSMARSELVEKYIWMVKQIVEKTYRRDGDFFEIFVHEGIIHLYDLADAYAQLTQPQKQTFASFAEKELTDYLKILRQKNNTRLYPQRSISAPLYSKSGDSEKTTLEAFIEGINRLPKNITPKK